MAIDINAQFAAISAMIERDGGKAYKATAKEINKSADDMVFQAQRNAPADKYNLENAIFRTNKREIGENFKTHDPVTGKYLPYKVKVDIKKTMIDRETGKQVNVEAYSLEMEESERYNPSRPGNIAKRNAGGDPGRKYMERAYVAVMDRIYERVAARVRAAL